MRRVVLQFDRPMSTGANPTPGSFMVQGSATLFDVTSAVWTGPSTLTLVHELIGSSSGIALGVYYTPGAVPVVGADGLAVAPFAAFPYTLG